MFCLDEVAVIDEIQMIKDPSRGWAWTRALLGELTEIHQKKNWFFSPKSLYIDNIICNENECIK